MIQETVKFVLSPFNPNIETVGNLVLDVHTPYNEKMVTLKINPNIGDYQDKVDTGTSDFQVRQVMVSQDTENTQTLTFDFDKQNTQEVKVDDKSYEIKLLNISKEKIEGQDFPVFEFFVSEK